MLPTMVSAQTVTEFKSALGEPILTCDSTSVASVIVREYGNVSQVVAKAVKTSLKSSVKGYRVCIFFDNGENARTDAMEAKTQFESLFPAEKVYIAYDNPYFMVTIGDCLTSEEGVILMGRVRNTFPKAYLKSENISFAELLKEPEIKVKVDSLEVVPLLEVAE